MHGTRRLSMVLIPTILLIASLAAPPRVIAALIRDDFEYPELAEGDNLSGHGGGTGWYSSWGDGGAVTVLHSDLTYSRAGYVMTGGPGAGKACKTLGVDSLTRSFAASAVGTAWFSVLVENTPQNGGNDIVLGAPKFSPQAGIIEFGLDGDLHQAGRPFIFFRGDAAGELHGPPINVQPVNLLVGRIDIDYDAAGDDRVRLWVDPPDLLSGEAGLGPATIEHEGYDAWSSWSSIYVQLAAANCIDSLRIATNGTSLNRVLRPDCGDGGLSGGETCDDANDVDSDGCTSCQIDDGWICSGQPSACSLAFLCGDGRPDPGEECDDGNLVAGDGCEPGCTCTPGHACSTCTAELSACSADLSDTIVDLEQTRAELIVATADADGDGVRDPGDACPGTPAGLAVDQVGCSREQFCNHTDATTSRGARACRKADWQNDQPVMKPSEADCHVDRRGPGPLDDGCVSARP